LRRAWLAAALALAACGDARPMQPRQPEVVALADAKARPARRDGDDAGEPEQNIAIRRAVATMLERVARKRALPAKAPVPLKVLPRAEVLQRIREKTDREVPKGVLEAQGELLRAFGLTDPSYDFVRGMYELIEGNIAGFYDQDENAMFMPDDLPDAVIEETLAHELVHALQDQHFDLGKMLEQAPGDSDRITAGHALCEGDAMSAMFDLTVGDAALVDTEKLRLSMVASVALSGSGGTTPRVLQAALIAPYVDGFQFVQSLRKRGGWSAVDGAYKLRPTSTEQLLHLDKYDAREPPILVPEPPMPQAGADWQRVDADVLGEQGLRMVLEQLATRPLAADGAAGWGGDRFLVARRDAEGGGSEWAVAWHIRFDGGKDAGEAEQLLKKWQPSACVERTHLGPLAWKRSGDAVALVGGPYRIGADGALASASDCKLTSTWLKGVLATR
jgi:hypothetical protein